MTNCAQQLKKNLLELLFLLKALSNNQRQSLTHFERCEHDILKQDLPHIIETSNDEQLENLIQISQEHPEEIKNMKKQEGNNTLYYSVEQIVSFGCLFRLLLLQEMLHVFLSINQLMKLIEIIPVIAPDQQLKLLHQFRQLLLNLSTETIQTLHSELQSGKNSSDILDIFFESDFSQDQFFLCQPLTGLLHSDLEDVLHICDVLPKLQPLQLVQLIRLFQLDPLRILEIRQFLSPYQNGWLGLQGLVDEQLPEEENDEISMRMEESSVNELSLVIIEQPPERTVYKRNLRPNPAVMIKGDERRILKPGESLCIVPVLYRCDTLDPVQKLSDPNPINATVGSVVKFKRLKILITSHQLNETLFFIRFELRKTDGNKQSETLASVQSNPIMVVSHSTLMKACSFFFLSLLSFPSLLLPSLFLGPTFYFISAKFRTVVSFPSLVLLFLCLPHETNEYYFLLIAAKEIKPSIAEIIPTTGTTNGGTRVAILGTNFVDSPAVRVKFDDSEVIPIFHGTGTLLCNTPRHHPGQVMVSISNNGKTWSDKIAFFTYEDILDDNDFAVCQSNDVSMDCVDFHQLITENNYDWSQLNLTESYCNLDIKGFTALHYTSAVGDEVKTLQLLQKGFPVNVLDKDGNIPLYWAIFHGHEHLLPMFIHYGSNINHQNYNGDSLLHIAASNPSMFSILVKLIFLGSWVNGTSLEGNSPLHNACATGNLHASKLLIQSGAFINAEDDESESPLHYAVRENQLATVNLLIHDQIDVNHQNEDGETALVLAIACGHMEIAQLLINHKQTNVNLKTIHGLSALHIAVQNGSTPIIDQLIKAGADVNDVSYSGTSPMEIAMQTKQSSVIVLLQNHGALAQKLSSSLGKIMGEQSMLQHSSPFFPLTAAQDRIPMVSV